MITSNFCFTKWLPANVELQNIRVIFENVCAHSNNMFWRNSKRYVKMKGYSSTLPIWRGGLQWYHKLDAVLKLKQSGVRAENEFQQLSDSRRMRICVFSQMAFKILVQFPNCRRPVLCAHSHFLLHVEYNQLFCVTGLTRFVNSRLGKCFGWKQYTGISLSVVCHQAVAVVAFSVKSSCTAWGIRN